MISREEAYSQISALVQRFNEQKLSYQRVEYNETQTRRDFIDPLFKALGWDVDNSAGAAESYREVIHEDRVRVGKATKAPDYSFRLPGGKRLFFLEAKKPSVLIKEEIQPAYQVRRYGWSAKMAISVVTDFEEFAVYDCSIKPRHNDKASVGRIRYLTYNQYLNNFDWLWATFSRESVLKGGFDRFVQSDAGKKGSTTVDDDFLLTLDRFRKELAQNIALRNADLTEDDLNLAVQLALDRIVFLRIAEDRGVEPYGNLQAAVKYGNYWQNLLQNFVVAEQKYNSGLFALDRDTLTSRITIDNRLLKTIIGELYYPECPYEFSALSVEILGSAYERFLGKQIRLTPSGRAIVEEKPEVRKAGGVFYTPEYVVQYIVENTLGQMLEGKTPVEAAEIKILDPACGSGSFLIGAYDYLLKWHKDYYTRRRESAEARMALTPTGELSTSEKKRILLNNIFGVDLDASAVEVTKLSLLLKCLEGETEASIEHQLKVFNDRVLPSLENNIKCGNSLIDLDFYDNELELGFERKIKPFSWEKAFPQAFERHVDFDKTAMLLKKQYDRVLQLEKDAEELLETMKVSEPTVDYVKKQDWNRGFNLIISNPPYVKVSDKTLFAYFSEKYRHQDYQRDLYLLFLERYNYLLADGGLFGVIIPNTWLQSLKYRNIRSYLVNNFFWRRILHIKDRVFKAVVDTNVMIFEKNGYIKNREFKVDEMENHEVRSLQTLDQYSLPQNGDVINVLASDEEKRLFEKIKGQSVFVGGIAKVYSGITLFEKGKGTPPQTERTMKTKPFVSEAPNKPEKGKNWLPLMRGSLMNRYANFWKNNYWVDYGQWLAAPRNPLIFSTEEKIIVRQTGDSIIATIIGKDIICRKNLHILISENKAYNHKLILGILNSRLAGFFYEQINPEKGEALAEVKKNHVEQLPLPVINDSNKDKCASIAKNVEQLLALNIELQTTGNPTQKELLRQHISYVEDKIDSLIYEIYNLSENEINIIQKNG